MKTTTVETGHPDQLGCSEVWGGNRAIETTLKLPGLSGWLYSFPFQGDHGGDVYYLSACDHGLVSRIALADVSGHGDAVSSVAEVLHWLMQRYINNLDQSDFMRELNDSFGKGLPVETYASMVLLSYYRKTGHLLLTNAGHLAPLWYRAAEQCWEWLERDSPYKETAVEGLLLGLSAGTGYSQTAFRLAEGDLLVLYTDGITETFNGSGQELGHQRLWEIARSLPVQTPAATGEALLACVQDHGRGAPRQDDETLLVLQRLAGV